MPEGYAKKILEKSLDRHTLQALHLCQMPEMPEEPQMENERFNAPYIPFKTLLSLLDRLKENGIPNRIDRTYLGYTSGAIQTYLLSALRAFGLINENGRPTEALVELAEDEGGRPQRIGELVRKYYADALALGPGATPGELAEVFRDKYELQGDTARKGITFFLNAAGFGGVEVSPHYKLPRGSAASSTARTTARRSTARRRTARRDSGNGGGDYTPPGPPSLDALKTRYVEMLMKRVEDQDEVDEKLLDRIEALLGYEGSQAHEEGEDEE
jgi:hypothetical protein